MPHKDPDRRRAYHREKMRRLRAANPVRYQEAQAKRRAAKKASGICAACLLPALSGRRLCSKHQDLERERSRRSWTNRTCAQGEAARVRAARFRATHPDRLTASTVKYRTAHIVAGLCISCSQPAIPGQRKCVTHQASMRTTMRKSRYGLEPSQWQAQLERCHHRCEICGKRPPDVGGTRADRLVPDHDHETGVVRGVLCWHCNVGIGILGDSRQALERAVAYLHRASLFVTYKAS